VGGDAFSHDLWESRQDTGDELRVATPARSFRQELALGGDVSPQVITPSTPSRETGTSRITVLGFLKKDNEERDKKATVSTPRSPAKEVGNGDETVGAVSPTVSPATPNANRPTVNGDAAPSLTLSS
jgi:hypothetical protein